MRKIQLTHTQYDFNRLVKDRVKNHKKLLMGGEEKGLIWILFRSKIDLTAPIRKANKKTHSGNF